MKILKIIKSIIGIGSFSGIAILAYKFGEYNGRENEKKRNQENDEYDFYGCDYDEEDDECIAPHRNNSEV